MQVASLAGKDKRAPGRLREAAMRRQPSEVNCVSRAMSASHKPHRIRIGIWLGLAVFLVTFVDGGGALPALVGRW